MRLVFSFMLTAALTAGCGGKDDEDSGALVGDDSLGLLGSGLYNPFPNAHLIGDDGTLDLSVDGFANAGTPVPVERVNWRTGFSPGQFTVLRMPGAVEADFPSWDDPTPGEGSVLLLDATAGEWLPCMAELDAYPDARDPGLLIRPLKAMEVGHQIIAVVKTSVFPRPERFDKLIKGDDPPDDFGHNVDHYQSLMRTVEQMGVDGDEVALMWDFPIGDGTTPMTSALDQATTPGGFGFTRVRTSDNGDTVSPSTYRSAEGSFDVDNFIDDKTLDMAEDGSVSKIGSDTAYLYVNVPASVADAPAGSVPVVIYGHGLFSSPEFDLDNSVDSALNLLADEGGFILVGTRWSGLDYESSFNALAVAADFGRAPELVDAAVQSQVNVATLADLLVNGDLLDDDVFLGRDGQALADPSTIGYFGVSAGGIMGGVFMANTDVVDAGVLHVGGAAWSTLLERSNNWTLFELSMVDSIPDAWDRQQLYSMSQLYWDTIDPISYIPQLSTKMVLVQESMGDDAVHNMATELLARSLDIPVMTPAHTPPVGMDTAPADLPAGSSALTQFDSGRRPPPDENRPATSTGAHMTPMSWATTRAQAVDFIDPGSQGEVNHYCGADACTSANSSL